MTADEWVEGQSCGIRRTHSFALLHALHAARTGSKAVIVTSEDTDVILLCLAFQKGYPISHLSEVYDTEQQTGVVIGRQHM